jgi:hypothetical protein
MNRSNRIQRRHNTLLVMLLLLITILGSGIGFREQRGPEVFAALAATSDQRASKPRTAGSTVSISSPYVAYLPLVVGPPPTSAQLIHEALARGDIDADHALLYQVYALFDDPLLPQAYRGAGSGIKQGTSLMAKATAQFTQFAPDVQAALVPFFAPPYHQGSWYDRKLHGTAPVDSTSPLTVAGTASALAPPGGPLSQDWKFVDSEDQNVRVWWQKRYDASDMLRANQIREAIDTVAPKLYVLMDKEPLPDSSENSFVNGGSPRLDIALVDFSGADADADGMTIPFSTLTHCRAPVPAYIQINRHNMTSTAKLLATSAHEYMHALLYAYNVAGCAWPEYAWLQEATATWAEDYVFPPVNDEHQYAASFLNVPETSLEWKDVKDTHDYGAYLFLFYLARTQAPEWIRAIWEQSENYEDSLAAVNAALKERSGGHDLDYFWPLFTLQNWNDAPPYNLYQSDSITAAVKMKPLQLLQLLDSSLDMELRSPAGGLPHLSARYYPMVFGDENVRSVTFYNGLNFDLREVDATAGPFATPWGKALGLKTDPQKGAKVLALIKIKGHDWYHQDWSDVPFVRLCRDRAAERLEELVLVFSNTEWQDRNYTLSTPVGDRLDSTLQLSNAACDGWEGTMTSIIDYNNHEFHRTTTAQSTVRLVPLEDHRGPNTLGFSYLLYRSYELASGSGQWSESYSDVRTGCSNQVSTSGTIPPEAGVSVLEVYDTLRSGPAYRAFTGSGRTEWEVPSLSDCSFTRTIRAVLYGVPEPNSPRDWSQWLKLNSNGRGIDSTGSWPVQDFVYGGTITYSWDFHLRAIREP